jgi:hypothetical protein
MATTTPDAKTDIPWVDTISGAMGFGFIGIVIYAWAQPKGSSFLIFACLLLVAIASTVAGGLAGFIFGIPKTVANAATATATGGATAKSEYTGNSNLEQISDWLTKVLVGAGLVQLGEIRDQFQNLSERLGKSLGSAGAVVGPAVIIAYLVLGFLLAYLWARIYMAKALTGGGAGAHASTDGTAEATAGGATPPAQ